MNFLHSFYVTITTLSCESAFSFHVTSKTAQLHQTRRYIYSGFGNSGKTATKKADIPFFSSTKLPNSHYCPLAVLMALPPHPALPSSGNHKANDVANQVIFSARLLKTHGHSTQGRFAQQSVFGNDHKQSCSK